jgi:hypothetical protein
MTQLLATGAAFIDPQLTANAVVLSGNPNVVCLLFKDDQHVCALLEDKPLAYTPNGYIQRNLNQVGVVGTMLQVVLETEKKDSAVPDRVRIVGGLGASEVYPKGHFQDLGTMGYSRGETGHRIHGKAHEPLFLERGGAHLPGAVQAMDLSLAERAQMVRGTSVLPVGNDGAVEVKDAKNVVYVVGKRCTRGDPLQCKPGKGPGSCTFHSPLGASVVLHGNTGRTNQERIALRGLVARPDLQRAMSLVPARELQRLSVLNGTNENMRLGVVMQRTETDSDTLEVISTRVMPRVSCAIVYHSFFINVRTQRIGFDITTGLTNATRSTIGTISSIIA